MGSVIYQKSPFRLRRSRRSFRRVKIALLVFYLLALPTYLFIGLQPSSTSMAETLARESEGASGYLMINGIDLSTPVATVELRDHTPSAPEYIAGSFSLYEHKTLLIGHSSTIFRDLDLVKLGDIVDYNAHSYRVTNITTQAKERISMSQLLADAETDTLVIMTCTGQSIGGNDYSHRLILTAEAIAS